MRFGIRLVQYLGSPERLVELAVAAERAGADQVWFPHDAFMVQTWPLTGAVAVRTSTIGIGSIGTNPYTTDPMEIATYAATLDHLSGGRALLGLGLHTGEMVEWLGYDARDVERRTREATAIVRRLLRGEVVEGGEVFPWSDKCFLRMEPLRDEVPIYVAAFGRSYLALSGEIGDGSLPMATPPESARLAVDAVHEGARRAGRPEDDVDVAACVWLSVSEDGRAADAAMRAMIAYFGPYLEEAALATVGLSRADFQPVKALVEAGRHAEAAAAVTDEMLALAVSGTPDDVIERLQELRAAGVTQFNLGGPLGPDPAEAIRLLGERVMPAFDR